MRKIRGRKHMRILALLLAAIVAVTTAPVSVEAKSVKPKLNKTKLKIVKGKTAKLKVRNVSSKNIKKTVWTVNKSGKKVVAFTKKSNTSMTLKGKKKGTARITAKIKVGRKVYKRTAKVTVKLPASDKKDPGDEEEDEVEIEEDKKKDDISASTNIPNQMPNTLKPAISETEPPNEILSTPGKISAAPTITPGQETDVPEKTEEAPTITPEPEIDVPEKTEEAPTITPEPEIDVPKKTEEAPTIVPGQKTDVPERTEEAPTIVPGQKTGVPERTEEAPTITPEPEIDVPDKTEAAPTIVPGQKTDVPERTEETPTIMPEPETEDPGWTSGAMVTAKPTVTVTAAPETMIPATPTPPYNLTISEEMEAAGTKNKEDYRQDVDWSEPGQVTFTNVNGYNGGLMLKLQENGEPMDMSAYKYIEADVETWEEGGDEVFLRSCLDSSSIWSNIDGGKFEGGKKTGRRTVRFDITDYKRAIKSIAAIMISPRGDGTKDVHTSLTLYNVRFVPEGWTGGWEETPKPNRTPKPTTLVTAKPTATVTAAPETTVPATPAPPYNLTISEEMEAAGTKNKEDYRQDVDWSEPGQVTFTNVNGYNGGLMLKLQENGEPMDMSAYKYIEADVETWEEGGDEVFLRSCLDSSSIWSNIDGGKFEGGKKTGRRTVRFDITDYKRAIKSIAAIMISPRGDGTKDVHTSLTLYNVRFVSEGWTGGWEETPKPNRTPKPTTLVTAKPTATVTAAPETTVPATPAPPYNLTISEEMEAAGTKNKEDYRQNVDWSVPGQVTFTNVNGYNGGLMLKLQENGEPMDMSGYKYIEADVETWEDGGDEVFLKSFTDSSNIWDTIDSGKFEGGKKTGRRTVRFDIKDYKIALKFIGAIMISPIGDGTSDVHTSLTLYNVRFVSEGWVDEPEESPTT